MPRLNEAKRYSPYVEVTGNAEMEELDVGDYVPFDDHDRILKFIERLVEMAQRLTTVAWEYEAAQPENGDRRVGNVQPIDADTGEELTVALMEVDRLLARWEDAPTGDDR